MHHSVVTSSKLAKEQPAIDCLNFGTTNAELHDSIQKGVDDTPEVDETVALLKSMGASEDILALYR